MPNPAGVREVDHQITVQAPAKEVYRLIEDVDDWPQIFPPTVHVHCLERNEEEETLQFWATAHGRPRTWTSQRRLDPAALRVGFRQTRPSPPVKSMGGAWQVQPLPGGGSRVRLSHHYSAVDDDADTLALIDEAVEHNSRAELLALKGRAEELTGSLDPMLSFSDSVLVRGSVAKVYEFVNQADKWQERLPHVARAVLTEDVPGLQILEMDTRAADGSVHTTSSVRVCFSHERIAYKQLRFPPLMKLHTGCWSFEEDEGQTRVTSRHTVVVDVGVVEELLGSGSTLDDAKKLIRSALGGNSTATMNLAKEHVEAEA